MTTPTLLEAARAALDALERYQVKRQDFDRFAEEIADLRAAIEAAEKPKPVGMLHISGFENREFDYWGDFPNGHHGVYAAPHASEPARQPMTDEQRMLLIMAAFDAVKKPIVVAELCMEITRAIEAFHRIGSEGAKR